MFIKEPPRFVSSDQRPVSKFPKLPPVRSDGTRDPCLMHNYRVSVEVWACMESQEKRLLIERESGGKDTFSVPPDCVSIMKGAEQKLSRACN